MPAPAGFAHDKDAPDRRRGPRGGTRAYGAQRSAGQTPSMLLRRQSWHGKQDEHCTPKHGSMPQKLQIHGRFSRLHAVEDLAVRVVARSRQLVGLHL